MKRAWWVPPLAVACLGCVSDGSPRPASTEAGLQAVLEAMDAGRYEEALDRIEWTRGTFPEAHRSDLDYLEAEANYRLGEYREAFARFKDYLEANPLSERLSEVEERCFTMAVELIERNESFLGLGLFSTRTKGLEILEYLITRFPSGQKREAAQRRVAEGFFEGGDFESAQAEYEGLAKAFPASPFLPLYQYRVLLCQRSAIRGFRYDAERIETTLAGAMQYVRRWPDNVNTASVHLLIAELRRMLADRHMAIGSFYESRGRLFGAIYHYSVVAGSYEDLEPASEASAGLSRVRALLAARIEEGQDRIEEGGEAR